MLSNTLVAQEPQLATIICAELERQRESAVYEQRGRLYLSR